MKNVNIVVTDSDQTIRFAGEELKKYLQKLDNALCVTVVTEYEKKRDGIVLGLWDREVTAEDTTSVEMNGLCGTIFGSNPRSVLFAVYQYLEALGVRWVRHGSDGEFIPQNHNFAKDTVSFQRTAKYPHRAMMIEGALKVENLLENVDWCAKVGFNQYYLQFERPTYFLRRWYEHEYNPLPEKQVLTPEDGIACYDNVTAEIKKRGMELYVVGHGWHTGPFAFPQSDEELTEEQRSVLALRNGKRGYNENNSDSTQLCYSQAEVRQKITGYVLHYLDTHPEADYLMFPLADGVNNHCECEECAKFRPSDLYVTLLDEIDQAMTIRGYHQKIVVAIYCDFMWKPAEMKFRNPERFLYCYAPYHRTYLYSYQNMGALRDPLPPYVRNQLEMPTQPEDLLSFLKAWQDWQQVDSFAHEYYYYAGEHYFDFGSVFLAKVIYEDICALKDLNMQGMMSCQSQRSFMPTGLGSWVMAKTLWDDTMDFEALKNDYFESAFGREVAIFSKYLCDLSDIAHDNTDVPYDRVIDAARKMRQYIQGLKLDELDNCHAASIRYIFFHCGLLIKQCEADRFTKEVGFEKAKTKWEEVLNYVRRYEEDVQPVFDLHQYFTHIRQRMYPEIAELFDVPYKEDGTWIS